MPAKATLRSDESSVRFATVAEKSDVSSDVQFYCRLDEAGVRIRVITESQPDARLDRLLNRMKFDDAEIFAKQFKLDIQVSVLRDLATCDCWEKSKISPDLFWTTR